MAQGSDSHARHDALLVAGRAAGDLTGRELAAADALVRDCAECKALHDDLVSLARATASLPAATRRRDFRISPEQAARLRPAGWRGVLAAFVAPRMAFTRSLGVGLTTLGLAGLLLTALPSAAIQSSGPAGDPSTAEALMEGYGGGRDIGDDGSLAPVGGPGAGEPAPSMAAPAAAGSPAASADGVAQARPTDADAGTRTNRDTSNEELVQVEDAGSRQEPNYLLIGSVGLVLFGLALLVVRRVAGRIAAP